MTKTYSLVSFFGWDALELAPALLSVSLLEPEDPDWHMHRYSDVHAGGLRRSQCVPARILQHALVHNHMKLM